MRLRQSWMLLLPLACALQASAQTKQYSIPEKKGALRMVTAQMGTGRLSLHNDDTQLRVEWESPEEGMVMSAFIQPAEAAGDAKVCRDTWWPQTQREIAKAAKIQDLRLREVGKVALVEYMVPKVQGRAIHQRHVHAYLAGGDIWAEVHISKVGYTLLDAQLFDDIMTTLQIDPDYENEGTDYWRWGAIHSNNAEYAKTLKYFQRSLELEKKSPSLTQVILRKMITDLAYLYEKYGDLAKAGETAEYGLSRYPDYAAYHYEMACLLARTQKQDESLAELRVAYQNRHKYPEERPLPDPATDACFISFAGDKKFLETVRELKR